LIVAKLPSSFRKRNHTTRNYREQYARLPPDVARAVRAACLLFDRDPNHYSLRLHELDQRSKGHHADGSFSVTPVMQYRAIYVVRNGINIWYWIGTHADYKKYTGSKK
jgi:hypothetical protein